jgi:branched-chain amino acid transport system ATP-binding protein
MTLLEVREVTKIFGGLTAVMELNMDVRRGEIFGLIGPNGAGKSTALNIIGGNFFPTDGRVIFDGAEITKIPPHQRARRGIARVFQENILFGSFTVIDNIRVGLHLQSNISFSKIFWRSRSARSVEKFLHVKALETLRFVGLSQQSSELAVNLPHGSQRLLALGIALATEPKLLLLDEPVTGMNAEEVETMLALIRTLRDKKGMTCIIIEHNLKAVMGLCDKIAVLNFGIKIAEDAPQEIVENQAVMEAYLGTEEDVA